MSNYQYSIGVKVLIDSEVVDFNFRVPRGTLVVQILDDLEATLKVHPTIIATINDFGEIEKIENHYSTIDYLVQRYGTEYYVGGTTIVTFSYQGYVVDLEVPEAIPFAATFRTACKSFSLKTMDAAIKRQDGQIMDYDVFNRPTAFVYNSWGSYYQIVPRTKGDGLPLKETGKEPSGVKAIPEQDREISRERIQPPTIRESELLSAEGKEKTVQSRPIEGAEVEEKGEDTIRSSLLRLEARLMKDDEEEIEGVPENFKRKEKMAKKAPSESLEDKETTPTTRTEMPAKKQEEEIPEKEYPWMKESHPSEGISDQLAVGKISEKTEEERLLEELEGFDIEESTPIEEPETMEKGTRIEEKDEEVKAMSTREEPVRKRPTPEETKTVSPPAPAMAGEPGEVGTGEETSLPEGAREREEIEDFSLAEKLREEEIKSAQETEAIPGETTQRTTDIEYFKKMNPKKVFPLIVQIAPSPQQIPKKRFKRTTHIETPLIVESTKKTIPVKIVPVFPGCQVTPQEVTVDIKTKQLLTVRFYITPLIERGKVSSKVEFWHKDQKVLQVDTPASVVNKFWAKVTGITGAITGVIPGLLKLFNVDVNKGLSAGIQNILPAINVTSKTFLWIEIGLLVSLAGVTVGLLFLFKPVRELIKKSFYPTTGVPR
ncbi:MAG: hypothetical protein GF308_12810 [Candidatus Heimdallarchaeota archaeon]|nr:hypothetical protein [Candidatus Heimdallarchaeota archaeon]